MMRKDPLSWLKFLAPNKRMAQVASVIVILVGCLVLLGWSLVISAIAVLLGALGWCIAVLNRVDGDRIRSEDRMRSSEELLKLALQGSGQGIWDWDKKTGVLTWDDRCKEIFGLMPDFPVTYEWHRDALHPDDRQRVQDAVTVALRDRTEFNEEYRTRHPDGKMAWVLARGRGYCDGAGEAYRMSGTVLDISDRKQAEEALLQNEARFQRLAANIPGVLYQYVLYSDGSDAFTYLSPKAEEIYELTTEELQRDFRQVWQMIHPDDVERVQAINTASAQHLDLFDVEFRLIMPSGQIKWVQAISQPERQANGDVIWDGLITDISDRQQAEADLQERSEHIRLLFETTRDLLSTEQPLALIETLFAKLKSSIGLDVYFNYVLDEQQQKLHLMFHGGISDDMAQEIEWLEVGCAVCGTVAQQQCQIVQSDLQQSTDQNTELVRSLGLTAYSCQPLIAQGKLFGTLGFGSRSRTRFTLAQTSLFQALCDQIAIALERSELVSSLQQQTEELIGANRLKDEFLAALSHELRTPLNPILGWTKILQRGNLNPAKTTEALATIERNVKQQIALIDDLLDVSSIIQGKLSLKVQPIDLALVLNAAIDTVQFAAFAKSITLEFHILSNSIPRVMGDENRLQQIFWNLLSNAIKFTPDGGRVEVNLSWVNGNELETNDRDLPHYVQVKIVDSGIGIAPEFLPLVFDHFRQADGSSTRKYGGLGLGLAIVKYLIELQGGTVKAESHGVGQGAAFTVKLPLIQEPVAASDSPKETLRDRLQPVTANEALLTGLRILIVDDDPDNLELLRFLLEQQGAAIVVASSGQAALEALTSSVPDILISDIGMPLMNGYELLRQIRALRSQQDRQIPAIALTAFAFQEDEEQAIATGFQAYLSKPVNPIELVRAIAQQVHPTRHDIRH